MRVSESKFASYYDHSDIAGRSILDVSVWDPELIMSGKYLILRDGSVLADE